MEGFIKFLANEKALKIVKINLVIIVAILLPISYFWFPESFDLKGLLKFSIGTLLIMALISRQVTKSQIKILGFDIELENNQEIIEVENEIKIKTNYVIDNFNLCFDNLKTYNSDGQTRSNQILKEDLLEELDIKITDYKIKGKDTIKLDSKRTSISDNECFDKSFLKENISKLIGMKKLKSKKQKKKSRHVNVKRQGALRSFITNLLTTTMMSGAMLDLAWSKNTKALLIFIPTFLISLMIDSIFSYLVIRHRTRTIYLSDRKKTLAILNIITQKKEEPN